MERPVGVQVPVNERIGTLRSVGKLADQGGHDERAAEDTVAERSASKGKVEAAVAEEDAEDRAVERRIDEPGPIAVDKGPEPDDRQHESQAEGRTATR